MMKISWTGRNEEVLHRAEEERNIVHRANRRPVGLATACVGNVFSKMKNAPLYKH
jgi:hypothetical protein